MYVVYKNYVIIITYNISHKEKGIKQIIYDIKISVQCVQIWGILVKCIFCSEL